MCEPSDVSGTVTPGERPEQLTALPRLHVEPDVSPSTDVLRSRASLDAFCKVVREVNATLDAHKNIEHLHVFGALPPAAAVELGLHALIDRIKNWVKRQERPRQVVTLYGQYGRPLMVIRRSGNQVTVEKPEDDLGA